MSRVLTTAVAVFPITHSILPRCLRLSNLPPSLTATSHTRTFRRRFFSPYNFRAVSSPVKAGFDVFVDGGSIVQDTGATALVIAGAYALVSTFDFLSERNLIEQVAPLSHTHEKKTLVSLFSGRSSGRAPYTSA